MATVTGLTAARMLAIEAESVVGGYVNAPNGHLILVKHDTTTIDAGPVIGTGLFVDIVSDQANIDGLKTFAKKTSIELAAAGVALHIGTTVAGQSDALNITPYGASAAVMASGAEYSGSASTARAASAAQLELLNGGLNVYSDTGLTSGNVYARTKVMGLDTNGVLNLGRSTGTSLGNLATTGTSIWGRGVAVTADNAAHQGTVTAGISVAVNRVDPAIVITNPGGDSIQAYGVGYGRTFKLDKNGVLALNEIAGSNYCTTISNNNGSGYAPLRLVSTATSTGDAGSAQLNLRHNNFVSGDALIGQGPDGHFRVGWEFGGGYQERLRLTSGTTGGNGLYAVGPDHYFGAGAFGAGAGNPMIHIGSMGDTVSVHIRAENGTGSNTNLVMRSQGTGHVQFQNSSGQTTLDVDSAGTLNANRASDGLRMFGTELVDGGTANTQVYIRYGATAGMTLGRIALGAADSGGTGFRMLRVPN